MHANDGLERKHGIQRQFQHLAPDAITLPSAFGPGLSRDVIPAVEDLGEVYPAELRHRSQRSTLHFHKETAFFPAVRDAPGGLPIEGVGGPGLALEEGDAASFRNSATASTHRGFRTTVRLGGR